MWIGAKHNNETWMRLNLNTVISSIITDKTSKMDDNDDLGTHSCLTMNNAATNTLSETPCDSLAYVTCQTGNSR